MTAGNSVNRGYRKLIAYKKARELTLLTYKLTKRFPREERFVLLPQMRRAAISVMANIVEGHVMSTKEFIRYISISIGSATELDMFYELAFDLKYLKNADFQKAHDLLSEVKKLLYTYKRSLRGARL